jgi:hypothetical protein
MKAPTTVTNDHWTGVALENSTPLTALEALGIIEGIVPDRRSKPILVVGRSDEFPRMMAARPDDPFCCHRLDLLALPNAETLIEMWRAIGTTYRSRGKAAHGYWFVERDTSNLGQIYTHPDLFGLLETLAVAAGNQIIPGLKRPMTAMTDLRQKRVQYDAMHDSLPAWYKHVYFCFFENGPHPNWNIPRLWPTMVMQLTLGKGGRFDIAQARRHQVACPIQAVVQEEIPLRYEALALLMLTMSIDECKKHLGEIGEDLLLFKRLAGVRLAIKWDEELAADDKKFLDEFYRAAVGQSLYSLMASRPSIDPSGSPVQRSKSWSSRLLGLISGRRS